MTDTSKPGLPPPATKLGTSSEIDGEVDQLVSEADRMARGRPLLVGFIIGIAIAVGGAVFIVQNTDTVETQWLWFDFDALLWLSLAVAFLAGAIASPLILLGIAQFQRRRAKRLGMVGRLQRGRQARRKPKP